MLQNVLLISITVNAQWTRTFAGMKVTNRQLRARRALLQFKDVPLRTRKALFLYNVYNDSALLVLNRTSLICNNTLLALNWQNAHNIHNKQFPNILFSVWMLTFSSSRRWNLNTWMDWIIWKSKKGTEITELDKKPWSVSIAPW